MKETVKKLKKIMVGLSLSLMGHRAFNVENHCRRAPNGIVY